MSATGIAVLVGGGALVAGAVAAGIRKRRRHHARIAAALEYDLSRAVAAHMQCTGTSRVETERLDREFRRWFVVASAASTLIGMGSKAVDGYWHTLLDVDGGELYAAFSTAVAGRLIEHFEGVGSADLDAKAWVAYEAVWGEPPPEDLFPKPSEQLLNRYRAHAVFSGGGDGAGGGSGCDVSVAVASCGSIGSDAGPSGGGSCGGGGSSCGGGGSCSGG